MSSEKQAKYYYPRTKIHPLIFLPMCFIKKFRRWTDKFLLPRISLSEMIEMLQNVANPVRKKVS